MKTQLMNKKFDNQKADLFRMPSRIIQFFIFIAFFFIVAVTESGFAQNPIVKGKGLCDPQIRVYGNKAFLYATHDTSPNNKGFRMDDWWIWSSSDLVNWKYESTLKPEDTYYGKPNNSCWATDAASRNGKYYFYFSMGRTNVGVVVSDSPTGPWKDPLGKALLPENLTPTSERDPGILDDDNGNAYIVFGLWDFYVARLNDDMISLAETPRKIVLDQLMGPYGPGKTDDKPFLHKRNSKYYLSWGSYYAMSDNVYGPYAYKGSVIMKDRVAKEFQDPSTHTGYDFLNYDRHGSFFEMHNQWYYIYNDQSQSGSTPYFRNANISYIHYRNNGEMEPIYIDTIGVGRYNAAAPLIQAENYFNTFGTNKRECPEGGFEISDIHKGSYLIYPNVMNLHPKSLLSFRLACGNPSGGSIEIRANGIAGKLLGKCKIPYTGGWNIYNTLECRLRNKAKKENICLYFHGGKKELLRLDWLSFR